MSALIAFAKAVDKLSNLLGRIAAWAVLAAALISAGNAFIRYGFDLSSNAWLEIQWYLFAATVMLGAPNVLRLNEHVRVDILYGRLKGRGQVLVDMFGILVFLLPVMAVLTWFSWPLFMRMYLSHEMSANAGGLIRWPAMLLLPVGFGMMFIQGVAEFIKRAAYLTGRHSMDVHYEKPLQ